MAPDTSHPRHPVRTACRGPNRTPLIWSFRRPRTRLVQWSAKPTWCTKERDESLRHRTRGRHDLAVWHQPRDWPAQPHLAGDGGHRTRPARPGGHAGRQGVRTSSPWSTTPARSTPSARPRARPSRPWPRPRPAGGWIHARSAAAVQVSDRGSYVAAAAGHQRNTRAERPSDRGRPRPPPGRTAQSAPRAPAATGSRGRCRSRADRV